MIIPTQAQLAAALTAAKHKIQEVAPIYAHVVSDEILIPVVSDAITAALNAKGNP